MDREGFQLLDNQYKEELSFAKQQITEEVDQKYMKYHGKAVGTSKMIADAESKIQRDKERELEARIAQREKQINNVHFKQYGGRETAMKMAGMSIKPEWDKQQEQPELENKKAEYEQRMTEYYNEKSEEKEQKIDRGRSR